MPNQQASTVLDLLRRKFGVSMLGEKTIDGIAAYMGRKFTLLKTLGNID